MKVTRARQRLDELTSLLCEWADSKPHTIEQAELPSGQGWTCKPFIHRPLPFITPAVIGEALHNLRCALDHMAFELVAPRPGSERDVYFPIAADHARFAAASGLRALREAGPIGVAVAGLLRDRIQPYGGGAGQALFVLRKLDDIDKHRSLLKTMMMAPVDGIVLRDRDGQEFQLLQLASQPRIWAPVKVLTHKHEVVDPGRPQADLFFGSDVGPASNRSVMHVLAESYECVVRTINAIGEIAAPDA